MSEEQTRKLPDTIRNIDIGIGEPHGGMFLRDGMSAPYKCKVRLDGSHEVEEKAQMDRVVDGLLTEYAPSKYDSIVARELEVEGQTYVYDWLNDYFKLKGHEDRDAVTDMSDIAEAMILLRAKREAEAALDHYRRLAEPKVVQL